MTQDQRYLIMWKQIYLAKDHILDSILLTTPGLPELNFTEFGIAQLYLFFILH